MHMYKIFIFDTHKPTPQLHYQSEGSHPTHEGVLPSFLGDIDPVAKHYKQSHRFRGVLAPGAKTPQSGLSPDTQKMLQWGGKADPRTDNHATENQWVQLTYQEK